MWDLTNMSLSIFSPTSQIRSRNMLSGKDDPRLAETPSGTLEPCNSATKDFVIFSGNTKTQGNYQFARESRFMRSARIEGVSDESFSKLMLFGNHAWRTTTWRTHGRNMVIIYGYGSRTLGTEHLSSARRNEALESVLVLVIMLYLVCSSIIRRTWCLASWGILPYKTISYEQARCGG